MQQNPDKSSKKQLHSLKLTAKAIKMNGWKMHFLLGYYFPFGDFAYFQGRLLLVSGWVAGWFQSTKKKW